MLCPECGARVSPGFSHCPWCGHKVTPFAASGVERPAPDSGPQKASRRPFTPEEDAFVGPLFRFPPVTVALMVVNALVFAAMEYYGGSSTPFTLLIFGAKLSGPVLHGDYWRLFTANFIHIGLLHLVLNSLTLIQLGMLCENLYGRLRFINLYLLSGMGGFLASTLFLDSLSAGASACLAGLMGATLIFGWRHYQEIPKIFRPHFTWYLLPWVIVMIGTGFIFDRIDNMAHIGGLVTGGLCALVLRNQILPDPRARSLRLPILVSLGLLLFSLNSIWHAWFKLAPNLELARAVPGEQDPAGQIEVLSRFIDSDSSPGIYFYLRAQANYLAGRLEAAEADYREALARQYDEATVRNELAWTLCRMDNATPEQLEEAVKLARLSVRDDRNPANLNTLGFALLRKGELPGAITQLNAAIQLGGEGPDRAIDYYFLAMAHFKRGETRLADDAFKRAEAYFGEAQAANLELHLFREQASEALGKALPDQPEPAAKTTPPAP